VRLALNCTTDCLECLLTFMYNKYTKHIYTAAGSGMVRAMKELHDGLDKGRTAVRFPVGQERFVLYKATSPALQPTQPHWVPLVFSRR
jgi:hypothetical protein